MEKANPPPAGKENGQKDRAPHQDVTLTKEQKKALDKKKAALEVAGTVLDVLLEAIDFIGDL